MHWNNILNTFLQLLEKTAFLKQLLNNKVSDFIEGPQSFITMIDISSCPWVLLNPVLILVFSSNQYQHCLLNWKFKSLNWWECAIVWYRFTMFTGEMIENICLILKIIDKFVIN